jgi:methyl-accepting chemotaxis protein
MDSATQQNAALVEEAAAAAQSLQDQAASLAEAVAAFKLDMTQVEAPPATRAPRAVATLPRAATPAARAPAAPVRAIEPAQEDEWEAF